LVKVDTAFHFRRGCLLHGVPINLAAVQSHRELEFGIFGVLCIGARPETEEAISTVDLYLAFDDINFQNTGPIERL
jgi:hypothetical protein